MKKKLFLILILLFTITFVSCKKEPTTIINEIKNYEVDIEEKITISTLEDAIVTAISIAEQSSVAVISTNNGLFLNESHGSGVIIAKTQKNKYYVLTNRHVILNDNNKQKDNFYICLGSNLQNIKAKLEMFDDEYDIALLSFEAFKELKVAQLGDSTKLQKGRFVVAVGCPYDYNELYNTATVGNISHPHRAIPTEALDGRTSTASFIQHTASINFGNSGGGLFNLNGELIGINTWKITNVGSNIYEGLGFSIPIYVAYQIVKPYIK